MRIAGTGYRYHTPPLASPSFAQSTHNREALEALIRSLQTRDFQGFCDAHGKYYGPLNSEPEEERLDALLMNRVRGTGLEEIFLAYGDMLATIFEQGEDQPKH